ncbi:unnamed protein product [Sympodiomycopsis kandeliae]
MSRGGRGGARGGGPGGNRSGIPMGQLTFQDLAGLDKAEHLYPYMSNLPRPSQATSRELRSAELQLEYLDTMKKSAYWPVSTSKKQKELPRYTDRYRPEEQDRPSLKSINLQKEVFPRDAWNIYMSGETRRQMVKEKIKARKLTTNSTASANFNWDEYEKLMATGMSGDGDGTKEDGVDNNDDDDGLDEEAEMDQYEEEEDDDYAQNYFDNGEGDDGDDDGGGGEAFE